MRGICWFQDYFSGSGLNLKKDKEKEKNFNDFVKSFIQFNKRYEKCFKTVSEHILVRPLQDGRRFRVHKALGISNYIKQ